MIKISKCKEITEQLLEITEINSIQSSYKIISKIYKFNLFSI